MATARRYFDELQLVYDDRDQERYATPAEAEEILEACPSVQWRHLFALARHAGLRVPAESRLLRLSWSESDRERGRTTVRSPKTGFRAGHEPRVAPITPRLMATLQEAFDAAEEGQERIVTPGTGGRPTPTAPDDRAAAGVERWPRAFQTLRSSSEKQWAMAFTPYAVSEWVGHSITVSGEHCANAVPEAPFDRAAGALRIPVQHPAAPARTASQTPVCAAAQETNAPTKCEGAQRSATCCEGDEQWTRTQRIRTVAEMPFEVALLDTSPPPVYPQIAPKAVHLYQLGLRRTAIARRLGVTGRTAAKAVAWLRCVNRSGASSGASSTHSFSRRQSERHASTFHAGGRG